MLYNYKETKSSTSARYTGSIDRQSKDTAVITRMSGAIAKSAHTFTAGTTMTLAEFKKEFRKPVYSQAIRDAVANLKGITKKNRQHAPNLMAILRAYNEVNKAAEQLTEGFSLKSQNYSESFLVITAAERKVIRGNAIAAKLGRNGKI